MTETVKDISPENKNLGKKEVETVRKETVAQIIDLMAEAERRAVDEELLKMSDFPTPPPPEDFNMVA